MKKFSTESALAKSVDLAKEVQFTYKLGLSIVASESDLNHQVILFRVFLNGLTVVSTTFSGKDSISSHVNGI
ncbi:hypothetical protein J6V86_00045 [bacterium]|nr:hypothetical protein [bacterium]